MPTRSFVRGLKSGNLVAKKIDQSFAKCCAVSNGLEMNVFEVFYPSVCARSNVLMYL